MNSYPKRRSSRRCSILSRAQDNSTLKAETYLLKATINSEYIDFAQNLQTKHNAVIICLIKENLREKLAIA